jgi:genome
MKSLMPQIDSNDGLFHNGNPATGEQGTRVTDTWLNNLQDRVRDVQAEAHYVLQKAGFTPKAETQTQLYQAIVKIIDDNRKTASLTQKGETKLYTGYDSQSEDLALTPKTAYQLKQLIDSNTRSLGNFIPNSKKSSAVNSNSADTVATSAAVKTAYDKGVEAKNAADNAQRSANDGINRANNAQSSANKANNNANGRVSKSGDTMTGHLIIKDGDYSSVRTYNNDGESVRWESTPANNNDIFAKIVLAGKNEQVISSISLPKKSGTAALLEDVNKVKNDVYNKSRFSHRYYANHYEGAEVYDMPIGDREVMRVIIMGATIDGYAKVSLPERFSGTCRVMVMDVGSGRHVVGANIQDYNKVEVHNIGRTGLNIMAIGYYSW